MGTRSNAILIAGCGPLASTPDDHAVDPWKELLIHDAYVRSHENAKNAQHGPLSFAGVATKLVAPNDAHTSAAQSLDWMQRWAPARASCQWLHAKYSNHCSADCTHCDAREVDWADAPVRLLAVVNRVDLSENERTGGEARLVYGLSDGPGDDARSAPLDATFIVEFRQDGEAARVAQAWHDLGNTGAFDDPWVQQLTRMVSQFSQHEHLARVRTHVGESTGVPRMREFSAFGATGDRALPWLPEVPPSAQCQSCHAQGAAGGNEFHLRAMPDGKVLFSRFLNDPDRPNSNELTLRAQALTARLHADTTP